MPSPAKRPLHATPTLPPDQVQPHLPGAPPGHPSSSHASSPLQQALGNITTTELFQVLTDTQSKSNPHVPTRGLMFPGPIAQQHPVGPQLRTWGHQGCPANLQDNWTLDQLDAAVAYGAHPSASTPEAAEALRHEALEKVEQRFAKLMPWSQLRQLIIQGSHKHTKVSPIAAIPHKSRLFRMILDLSSKGQRRNQTQSVNELTDEASAPNQSMAQLGQVLGRFIHAVATAPPGVPLLFSKLDIKDGFWRMCVPENDEFHFCYVLPRLPNEPPDSDPMIVVPSALQMGWTSSPAFFCAATETGRDIAEFLRDQPQLPAHPLEHHMMDPIEPHLLTLPNLDTLPDSPTTRTHLRHLFEVYVDDYCALLQATDADTIRHHSRALLHAIHQIFPPPTATGHDGEDPISHRKLVDEQEGVWATRKEILGWIFDGIQRTVQLPQPKVDTLRTMTQTLLRHHTMPTKDFESFMGKCQNACIGIPGGKGLLAPLYKALHAAIQAEQHHVTVHPASSQARALTDLTTMFKILADRPTKCVQLTPGTPHYIGHSDACKHGAGGIWLSGLSPLRPLVWRFRWPPDVIAQVEAGTLSINDLEMAGLLLHYLLLEALVPMRHRQAAAWVDNTSAVSWCNKLSSSRSLVGQQLVRALAFRFLINESSHLAALSIAGADNKLADLASRSFKATGTAGNYDLTDCQFLTMFNSHFPLTQKQSWLLLRPNTSRTSLVCSILLGETPSTGSWTRLPKCGSDIGLTGSTSAPTSCRWTPFSEALRTQHGLQSSKALPDMSVKGARVEDTKSGLDQFQTRYAPSARPSLWTAIPTHSTDPTPPANTGPH